MFQPNVPRKTTALIQVWGCVLLVLVSVFLSFAPLITLQTNVKMGDIDLKDSIEDMIGELAGDVEVEIPDDVEVSAVSLVSSISMIIDAVKIMGEDDVDEETLEKFEALIESEEGKQTLLTVAALAATITNTVMPEKSDDKSEGGSAISTILSVLVVIIAVLYVLIFTLVFPIIYVIVALTAVIPALTNMKNPLKVAPKISKKLPGLLSLPLVFMLFQCVIPGMGYGYGALGLWIAAAVCVLLNLVVSRLRQYTDKECLYLTVVQGGALLGAIGYIVFFFNIIKTNIFNKFLHGGWADYVARVAKEKALIEKSKEAGLAVEDNISNAYLVDGVLIIIFLLLVISSISYINYCAHRLSATSGNAKKAKGDNHIVFAVLTVVACALPMYVMGTENLKLLPNVKDSEGISSLILNDAQESALTVALVGAIIMVVAEVAIVVLKKVFCKDLSDEDMTAVMSGTAKTPDEKIAEAQKLVEEAKAAEAARLAEAQRLVAEAQAAVAASAEAPAEEEAPKED